MRGDVDAQVTAVGEDALVEGSRADGANLLGALATPSRVRLEVLEVAALALVSGCLKQVLVFLLERRLNLRLKVGCLV